jgi:hypothetical protein
MKNKEELVLRWKNPHWALNCLAGKYCEHPADLVELIMQSNSQTAIAGLANLLLKRSK